MGSIAVLSSNVAAATDKTKLESADLKALQKYAENTCSGYCAGCSDICESAMGQETHIADVMRYLMYYKSYGDAARAREHFAELPSPIRMSIGKLDYSKAESVCPHKVSIGELMKEAKTLLA
jgi:predicted aldo/keto reductase-like oxidoreductase